MYVYIYIYIYIHTSLVLRIWSPNYTQDKFEVKPLIGCDFCTHAHAQYSL